MTPPKLEASVPWWRIKLLWLVVGGPAAVVLAGVVTTVIATRGSDAAVQAPSAARADAKALSTAPAVQARNHVATAAAR